MKNKNHMAQKWNERARGKENGIFKKQVVHLIRKYKNYKKLRSKEDAINNEEARALLSAVEYVPNIQQNLPINDEYRNHVSTRDLPNARTSTTANITEHGTTQQIQKMKRKSCDTPGCVEKYGDTCPKKYSRRCKLLEEQGVTFEKLKRKAHIRSCANPNCFDLNCKATNNRMRCIALVNENTS